MTDSNDRLAARNIGRAHGAEGLRARARVLQRFAVVLLEEADRLDAAAPIPSPMAASVPPPEPPR